MWDNIVEYLSTEKPDILLLQEAYQSIAPDPRPYMNTAASLQQILGFPFNDYEPTFTLNRPEETAIFGNAILSKFALSKKNILWLQGQHSVIADARNRELIPTFPRNLLHCQADINGKAYNLMTLQGIWAKDGTETEAQKQMGKRISDYIKGKDNVILAGDFNVNEKTETIVGLEKDMVNIFKDERISSFNMKHKTSQGYAKAVVDFVFTSPHIKVLNHYTSQADVSDHQSQVVMLDL